MPGSRFCILSISANSRTGPFAKLLPIISTHGKELATRLTIPCLAASAFLLVTYWVRTRCITASTPAPTKKWVKYRLRCVGQFGPGPTEDHTKARFSGCSSLARASMKENWKHHTVGNSDKTQKIWIEGYKYSHCHASVRDDWVFILQSPTDSLAFCTAGRKTPYDREMDWALFVLPWLWDGGWEGFC